MTYFEFFKNYPRFWPKSLDLEVRYGPISVRYLGCGKYPNLIVRAFAIHKVSPICYIIAIYMSLDFNGTLFFVYLCINTV